MRILTAIVLLLACVCARAGFSHGYIFTISPNPVPPGADINVTIETIGVPCVPLWDELFPVVEEGGIVYLTVPGSDGCDAVAQETRHYNIGVWPPGQYFFRFYTCAGLDAETGEEACGTLEEVPVTVLGLSAQTATIPALSTLVLIALGLLMMVAGWVWSRR